MRRRWSAALLAVAMLPTLAGPAQASTTWESGDTLYYVASPGEVNALSVNPQGADATMKDSGYPTIGMIAPCRPCRPST